MRQGAWVNSDSIAKPLILRPQNGAEMVRIPFDFAELAHAF